MDEEENIRLLKEVKRLEQEVERLRAERDMYRLESQRINAKLASERQQCVTPVEGTPEKGL